MEEYIKIEDCCRLNIIEAKQKVIKDIDISIRQLNNMKDKLNIDIENYIQNCPHTEAIKSVNRDNFTLCEICGRFIKSLFYA